MDKTGFELSRRKILAGLGTIGLASAGAGLGTSAYFSDREDFENNQLVAGELDLQVDWQEHYSDWSEDERDAAPSARMVDDPEDVGEDEFGLPVPEDPMLAIASGELKAFLDATATEAWPDEDGDGIQDMILTRGQIADQNPTWSPDEVEEAFHDQFADVPDDLERPVIELGDVKPGDFGEVTFSTHLHNNPGYLWLTGELLDANENGLSEPERKDSDEEEGVVELLDAIQVAVWYDDGDNVREEGEIIRSPHDVEESSNITLGLEDSLIARGTLREVLEALGDDPGIPLDADPTTTERNCYPNSTTYYFGFAWWLPVDHANEIQTDSVTFDLGFYTEQCRHNDGSGMPAEVASVDIPDVQTVSVEDDGSTMVHVDKTTLPEGGFVVLHNETLLTQGDAAGSVIGNTAYLTPGTHGNLEIEVADPPNDIVDDNGDGDSTVIAMAHKDTNDNQTYDFPNADGPYTIDGSAVVDPGVVNVENGS
jgi:predicted ribosomally synthesized peptide with SipW-like signal peptide